MVNAPKKHCDPHEGCHWRPDGPPWKRGVKLIRWGLHKRCRKCGQRQWHWCGPHVSAELEHAFPGMPFNENPLEVPSGEEFTLQGSAASLD